MANMTGRLATKTIAYKDKNVTVVWPDLAGAETGEYTELSIWKREADAQIYYQRIIETGSNKPRVPWMKAIVLLVALVVLCVTFQHVALYIISALFAALFIAGVVIANVRSIHPIVEGKGIPKLVCSVLEKDQENGMTRIADYITETNKAMHNQKQTKLLNSLRKKES